MILVEGGPFSVHTVCHALESNTPVVVVNVSRAEEEHENASVLFLFQIKNRDQVEQPT